MQIVHDNLSAVAQYMIGKIAEPSCQGIGKTKGQNCQDRTDSP